MKRSITGYGVDEQGDWFATLDCGHRQHVRHKPPFINRPWVITEEGRNSFLGHELNCIRCDRMELPDADVLVLERKTPKYNFRTIPSILATSNQLEKGQWGRVIPVRGQPLCVNETINISSRLRPDMSCVIPPETSYRLELDQESSVCLEIYRVRESEK